MCRLNLPSIRQAYGLTETSFGITVQPSGKIKYGSVGHLVSGMMAKIINIKTGKALGPNELGEFCFKGPMMMKGYCENPMATAQMIDKNGWLHSGDLGYYDEDDSFFIVDRLKELIKCNGFQVSFTLF